MLRKTNHAKGNTGSRKRTVLVPEETQKKVRALVVLRGQGATARLLRMSVETLHNVVSWSGRLAPRALERIERNLEEVA